MSVAENIAVVRRHLDTLASGDIDASATCYAPDTLNHGRPTPPDVMRRVLASLHTLQECHTVEEIIAVGDKVMCRTTRHSIHAGTPEFPVNGGILQGVLPTAKGYTVQHIHSFGVPEGLGFAITPPR